MQAPDWLIGDAFEDVGKPGLRVEIVELGRSDQRVHGCGASAATIRAAEQPRFSAEGDTAQRSFGRVVTQYASVEDRGVIG